MILSRHYCKCDYIFVCEETHAINGTNKTIRIEYTVTYVTRIQPPALSRSSTLVAPHIHRRHTIINPTYTSVCKDTHTHGLFGTWIARTLATRVHCVIKNACVLCAVAAVQLCVLTAMKQRCRWAAVLASICVYVSLPPRAISQGYNGLVFYVFFLNSSSHTQTLTENLALVLLFVWRDCVI